MKLQSSIHEVKSSGERLTVRLKAEKLRHESGYSEVLHEIDLPDSATARKTYYIGRLVEITINPK